MCGVETQVECIVLDQACGSVLPINKELLKEFDNLHILLDDIIHTGGEIDLLIGMSSPQFHKQLSMRGKPNQLAVIETPFGHCLVGPVQKGSPGNYKEGQIRANSICMDSENIKDENVMNCLEAELSRITKECICSVESDDKKKFNQLMKSSWCTGKDGRFEVKLPWKIDPATLENNKEQAISRDIKLNAYLGKHPKIFELFIEQIESMIKEGILRGFLQITQNDIYRFSQL